jgi:hypothetical protein
VKPPKKHQHEHETWQQAGKVQPEHAQQRHDRLVPRTTHVRKQQGGGKH